MKKFNKKIVTTLVIASFMLGFVGLNSAHAATSPSLGEAESFSVLGATGITGTVPTSGITGDVGNPDGGQITGLTDAMVNGTIYSSNLSPTLGSPPAATIQMNSNVLTNLSTAYDNLNSAVYDNGIGNCIKASNGDAGTDTGVTELGGKSLVPGVYCTSGSFQITGDLTLDGTTGTWVFKAATGLTTAADSSVTGGDPCNVWWRIGTAAAGLGTNSTFIGTIIASTGITFGTGVTLDGRALALGANVTLNSGGNISGPTCSAPVTGTCGTAATSYLYTDVAFSGTMCTLGSGITTPASPVFPSAGNSVTWTCGGSGGGGSSATCTASVASAPSSGSGGSLHVPIIDIVKVPSPLALPNGPGPVTYTYTVRNIGIVPMNNVTVVDDSCSPMVFVSGDTNRDSNLDVTETWTYDCFKTLSATQTNTVIATGWNTGFSATDIAIATVVVGVPIVPPLIHITKVPSPQALSAVGGMVTYTKKVTNPGTVALSNVLLTDDKCGPVQYISGDTNNDAKLDVNEIWTYTCQANLTKTTTNTASVSGQANGLTARDFAIATVVVAAPVSVPTLPNTGFPPEQKSSLWNVVMLVGIAMLALASLVLFIRKRTA